MININEYHALKLFSVMTGTTIYIISADYNIIDFCESKWKALRDTGAIDTFFSFIETPVKTTFVYCDEDTDITVGAIPNSQNKVIVADGKAYVIDIMRSYEDRF